MSPGDFLQQDVNHQHHSQRRYWDNGDDKSRQPLVNGIDCFAGSVSERKPWNREQECDETLADRSHSVSLGTDLIFFLRLAANDRERRSALVSLSTTRCEDPPAQRACNPRASRACGRPVKAFKNMRKTGNEKLDRFKREISGMTVLNKQVRNVEK